MSFRKTILASLAGGVMCAAAMVGLGLGSNSAAPALTVAQPEEGFQPTPEMIKAMMEEQAKPAPQHEWLHPLVGKWDAKMYFLMEPGGEPEESTGTSVNTLIHGGRYLHTDFKGDLTMFGDKMAFTGSGLLGFDKVKGEFFMTWVDSLSTALLVSYGAPGEDPKRIEASGTAVSQMGEAAMKHVYVIESDKKHTLEFWQGAPGVDEMMKIGWIEYTKKEG